MELDVNMGLDAIKKYKIARTNFLAMCILTIVNVILTLTESGNYFLFSANIPLYCVALYFYGVYTAGRMFILIIGLSVIAVLFILFFLSQRSYLAMVAATIIFVIDFIFLIIEIIFLSNSGSFGWILDFLFHCWIIYYFVIGLKYGKILIGMPNGVNTTSEEYLHYMNELKKQEEEEFN